MPFLILFGISWLSFGLFANKHRWREFLPASMLAMLMSLTSDVLMYSYPLWVYQDGTELLTTVQVHLLDDWGIYPVTAFLFVQYFPETKGLKQKWLYFFAWTTGVILLEALFCQMGWMKHQMWWNLFLSYLADWLILFGLLRFNLRFRKKMPSRGNGAPASNLPSEIKTIPLHPASQETKALVEYMRSHGLELFDLLQHPNVTVLLCEIPPGSIVPDHMHAGEEFLYVIEGELEMVINSMTQMIRPGMMLNLPGKVSHCAQNHTQQKVTLLCLLTPEDAPDKRRHQTPEKLHNTAHAII